MTVPAPHFFLYPEAVPPSPGGNSALGASLASALVGCESILTRSRRSGPTTFAGESDVTGWRFVLRLPDGETSLEAGDVEEGAGTERLELLAIVRGLEALDQPSRVTLVASANIERGLKFGLAQWRESDWQWERFGRMTPIKNRDLWQRLDRLLEIHSIHCRPDKAAAADDLAPPPKAIQRSERRLRIDRPPAKSEIRSTKSETNSKSKSRNDRNKNGNDPRLKHSNLKPWNSFRISDFVLRALRQLGSAIGR